MPWGSVHVIGPVDEDVYVNGNYEQAAGKTNTEYSVEYGPNTFETLDEEGNVALRAEALVNEEHPNVTVELQPVEAAQSADGA